MYWFGGVAEAKPRLGLLKLKALKALYENTEDGRVYAWNSLNKLLVEHGLSAVYARQLLWDFHLYGILERLEHSLYKVNKRKLLEHILDLELKLARFKARARGGRSGPQG
jgi:hypothetical protein